MAKKINFEIEKAEVIDENPESQFATAKLLIFSSGKNLHDMVCSEDLLRETAPTSYERPIIFEINNMVGDFGSHNEGRTVPAGFIVPGSAEFIRQADGRLSLSVLGKIWKKYSGKFLDIFKQNDKTNSGLSVEMDLFDSRKRPDGLTEMLSFAYTAACILGDIVTPASPDANIQMLSFSKEDQTEYENAVKAEFGLYDDIDFTIPQNVKDNAKIGRNLYDQYGGLPTSKANANHLIDNEKIDPDRVEKIAKNLANRKKRDVSESIPPSKDYIDYMLHGGDYALEWIQSIVYKMKEKNDKKLSYFEGEKFVPYEKISEINPALKGIKPPITLGQANAIAKQADAIGTDKEKNGWAIAISNFKKTHKVEDGHWVEKDKNAMSAEDDDDDDNDVDMDADGDDDGDVDIEINIDGDDDDDGDNPDGDIDEDFASDELGTGETITVDKSKDAMSSSPWGNVDKTALRNKVLKAKNYKSLVNSVYALVDSGWEDHPSSSLHYPIMQISGNKAVYNRYGLSSALQRAEGQNETSVVSKIKGIYSKLGLDKPENNTKEAKKNMSLSANLDVKAMLAFLQDETESYQAIASEFAKPDEERDYAKTIEYMYAKMCKMDETNKTMAAEKEEMDLKVANMTAQMAKAEEEKASYMAENEKLKKFKDDTEQKDFDFAVTSTLKLIEETVNIPAKELEALRDEAKKFKAEDVEGFKNLAKAKAFGFPTKSDKSASNDDNRIGFPWGKRDANKKSLWDNVGNAKKQ